MTSVILVVDENSWLMAKKCVFYGEYAARNIEPEKSRDLGS